MNKKWVMTGREEELLRFIGEMGFASMEALFIRFFKIGGSKSMRYAEERLRLLMEAGHLKSIRLLGNWIFLLTENGYALSCAINQSTALRYVGDVDFRNFRHQLELGKFRALREREGKALHWKTENEIKREISRSGIDVRDFVPDAIYETPKKVRVALEIELTRKSRDRVRARVQRYESLMGTNGLFNGVLVVGPEDVLEAYRSEVRGFEERWRLQNIKEVDGEFTSGLPVTRKKGLEKNVSR